VLSRSVTIEILVYMAEAAPSTASRTASKITTTITSDCSIKFIMDLAKALWCILALLLGFLVVGVYRLATGFAKADQVLPIWEYIAELPFFGSFVGRIFTMILQIMNPYSRSIGITRSASWADPETSTLHRLKSDDAVAISVGEGYRMDPSAVHTAPH